MSSNLDSAVSALEAVQPELVSVLTEDVGPKVDAALAALKTVQTESTPENVETEAAVASSPLDDSADSSVPSSEEVDEPQAQVTTPDVPTEA